MKSVYIIAMIALATTGLVGCGKDNAMPAPAPEAAADGGSIAVRMADPVYRAQLKEHAAKRDGLMAQYARVTTRMREILAAKQAELGTADEAVLKSALDADPEWTSLYQRCLDLDVAIGEEQQRARETFRQRISK